MSARSIRHPERHVYWSPAIPNGAILCVTCGCRGGSHRATDGLCPPTTSFGLPVPFPVLGPDDGPDSLVRWDAKIAAYWDPTLGRFYRPRTP